MYSHKLSNHKYRDDNFIDYSTIESQCKKRKSTNHQYYNSFNIENLLVHHSNNKDISNNMFKHTLTDYVSEGSTNDEILIKYIANEKYNVIPEKILPNENIIETLRKYEHDGTEITLQELYDVKKKFPLYSEEREIIGKFVKKKFFDTIILKVSKFFKLSEIPKDKLEYLIADIFGMDDKSFKLSTRLSIREIVAYGIKKGYLQNIH